MAHYVTAVASPMSLDAAFAYMADLTHFSEWDPGIPRSVKVSGEGFGVGVAYDVTIKTGPARTVMRYVVTEYEPPRRIRMVSETAFLHAIDEVRVAPAPGGSVVTYDATLILKGPLRVGDFALAMAFKRIGDRAAVGLRRVLKASS